jgi:putative protease
LAALTAGADAVYLGIEDFNARRNAQNFNFETLAEACDLAHLAGRRIYLTLNTVILPDEMKRATQVAQRAWESGVDALIVQDLGLLARLSREMPQCELHASTQMNLHNAGGVRLAAELGVSRITLARELSLEELSTLTREGVSLEVFAHGALCVCHSGQCLFSSLVGRRSANRGLCAQACRLPYQLIDTSTGRNVKTPGEHLLSPGDLATINILPQLVETGIAALKLEGRMKSASYVATVTRAYREALDELFADGVTDASRASARIDSLAETFSRGFTTAYLEGARDNSMMSYTRPNNRGTAVGRVGALAGGLAAIDLTKRVIRGDVLELWTSRGHSIVKLDDFWDRADTGSNRGKGLDEAPENSRIYLQITDPVSPGDRVFRVRSAELLNDAATTFGNTLFQGNSGIVALDARVVAQQGARLAITFCLHHNGHYREATATGDMVEAARTRALSADDIREHVGRVGGTPFTIQNWDIQLDKNVGIGFSALHRVRAEALAALTETLLSPWRKRLSTPRAPREEPPALAPARKGKPRVAAIVCDAAGARAAAQGGAELIYLHSLRFEATADADDTKLPSVGRLPGDLPVMRLLPAVTHDHEFDLMCDVLDDEQALVVNNLGELATLRGAGDVGDVGDVGGAGDAGGAGGVGDANHAGHAGQADCSGQIGHANHAGHAGHENHTSHALEAGPSLGVYNSETIDLCARLGLSQAWLSPELSHQNIALISPTASLPLTLTVFGQQEVMITEHCILMAQGPCNQHCAACARRKAPRLLEDRKGYRFPVRTDDCGRSHLFNAVPLDLIPSMPELVSLGISTFVVDGTLLTTKDLKTEVARTVRARDLAIKGAGSLPKREGYTTGHFFRGIW